MTVAVDPTRHMHRKRWLSGLAWLALTVALIVTLRTVPWQLTLARLTRVEVQWILLAACAYILPLAFWTQEWRILAPAAVRIAYARMFEVVAIMAAVLNTVPFFAGEASGATMLVTRAGLTRGAALSVLAIDQLVGGIAKLALLSAAAMFVPLPGWLRAGVLALAGGTAILLVLLVALAHRWAAIHDALLRDPTRIRRAAAAVIQWGRHFEVLRESHRVGRVLFFTFCKKASEVVAVLCVQAAFGVPPSLSAALLVIATLSIATAVPVAPANLGVYEAAVFGTYRYLGVSADTALGMAVAQHICFLVPMLGIGYSLVTLREVKNRLPAP